MAHTNIKPATRQRARNLRREQTAPERMLWPYLRTLKQRGIHFRRQAPIGPYIADFVWFSGQLIVEIDGWTHGSKDEQTHDLRRDEFLRSQGFRILRVTNVDVMENVEGVFKTVLQELD